VTYSASISTAFAVALVLHAGPLHAAQQPGPAKHPPGQQSSAQSPDSKSSAVNTDAAVIADFKARVDKYVDLRKKADDSAPPLKESKDAGKIKDAQQALVERIGAARSTAKQGDIFTPDVAALFRRLLHPETKEPGTKELMKEDKVGTVPFKINGPYPDTKPLATAPPNLLQSLPPLPKDLDYRFVGKHLILRDSRANMIIDYMLNAIP
jgi:hypothetical protein